MDPLTMHLASGASLFSGGALLVLAIGLSCLRRGRWATIARNLLAWLGLALVFGSATPYPLWVDGLILTFFLAWFLSEEIARVRRFFAPPPARIALAALVVLVAAWEAVYLTVPQVPSGRGSRLYVIGDSISAGIGDRHPPWPEVLATVYRIPVTNLSKAGSDVSEALAWVRQIVEPNAVVLIEIGGNDLLNGTSSQEFAGHLAALLAAGVRPDRMVVMLELPLIPLSAGYGRAQRDLAAQHGVFLIPKRYFAAVLSAPGASLDGLHLSEAGTHLMADTLFPYLAPAFGR